MPEHHPRPQGFDAPVEDAANDHLNRWPLAQQIYNVAANGPIDWSVRIGVYGEWGTGKTSVLKFVSSMAKKDGHIVVWFDPWAFTDKTEMWRTYVETIYKEVESKLGKLEEGDPTRRKELLQKMSAVVTKIVGLWNANVADLTKDGFALVKKHLSSDTDDLASLRHVMNGKRVFVIIDDLDRTAAELVPDILYALKEVMDIPGFSFICGFDPAVVGEALGSKHPGFGNGLKFLEKIIDYPIWLPPVNAEGLEKIALSDAKHHCPYVPLEDLKEVLPTLPQNPRATRQFIRLLALLRSQTGRYHNYELHWPVILTASVIKVCCPKVAYSLLKDEPFWHELMQKSIRKDLSSKRKEVDQEIETYIDEKIKSLGPEMVEADKNQLHQTILRIESRLNPWSTNLDFITSQILIVEQSQAVTWKEFDALLSSLDSLGMLDSLSGWIYKHAMQQHHRETDVAKELCMAAVDRYCSELHKADVDFDPQAMLQHEQAALIILELIRALVFKVGEKIASLEEGEWIPIGHIFTKLTQLAAATKPTHIKQWPSVEGLLIQLAKNSTFEVKKLRSAVQELNRNHMHGSAKEEKIVNDLNSILKHHLCNVASDGLTQAHFVKRSLGGFSDFERIEIIILNWHLPEYAEFRSKALSHFSTAADNPNVRENAYRLVEWLNGAFLTVGAERMQTAKALFQDREMVSAIWTAATHMPFAGGYAYQLREFPGHVKSLGIELLIPSWWTESINKYATSIQQATAEPEVAVHAPEPGAAS